jgi:hypothetical protein
MKFGALGALGTIGGIGAGNPVAGPATHFTIAVPATATIGVPFNITVVARDASENLATSYNGTVHLTSTDTAAVLAADAALVSGLKTFSVTLNTAGTWTITATEGISDNFNRADGALGSNWLNSPTLSGLTIVSNAVNSAGATWKTAYWNQAVNAFAANQSSQVTIPVAAAGVFTAAVVRHQAAASSYYFAFVNAGTNQGLIYRSDAGTFVNLVIQPSVTVVAGDTLKLEIIGSNLTLYVNGVAKAVATDATYATGQPGISANNGTIDNFAAFGGLTGTSGPIVVSGAVSSFVPTYYWLGF